MSPMADNVIAQTVWQYRFILGTHRKGVRKGFGRGLMCSLDILLYSHLYFFTLPLLVFFFTLRPFTLKCLVTKDSVKVRAAQIHLAAAIVIAVVAFV